MIAVASLLIAWAVAAPTASAAPVQATNPAWAGYSASGVVFNKVTATWTQPRITCKSGEQSQAWFLVGLDGPTNGADEQVGVEEACTDGVLGYWGVVAPGPSAFNSFEAELTMAPGDKMTATVAFVSPFFVYTIKDDTNGQSYADMEPCDSFDNGGICPRTSAQVIAGENSSTNSSSLADYGKVTFSAISMHTSHGKTGGFASKNWVNTRYTQKQGTVIRATASTLTSSGGFTDTWKAP